MGRRQLAAGREDVWKVSSFSPNVFFTMPEKRKLWKPNTCPATVFSPVPEVKIASNVKQDAGALHPTGLKVNSYDSFPRMLLLVTPRDHVVWALTDLPSSSYDLASGQSCSVEV